MFFKTLRRAACALALCSLLFVAKCPREPQPYEDPADCHCRVVNGRKVCNSACN